MTAIQKIHILFLSQQQKQQNMSYILTPPLLFLFLLLFLLLCLYLGGDQKTMRGHPGRNHMLTGITTTCTISTYHH